MSSQLKIVLVEDEPSLVSLYSVGLQSIGEVLAATNKADTMVLLQKMIDEHIKPDVVLLDLILPGGKTESLKFNDPVCF